MYDINKQVFPTAPSPTTTHLIVCIVSYGGVFVKRRVIGGEGWDEFGNGIDAKAERGLRLGGWGVEGMETRVWGRW